MSEEYLDAAKLKLKEIDSVLADKMEQFHSEIDSLTQSGASEETIQAAMKENMESLSETEKSELEQVFGKAPESSGKADARPDPLDQLIDSLSESDSELAFKLQSLKDTISDMKQNGESEEAIHETIKGVFDSLSDDEKDAIKGAAVQAPPMQGPPPGPPPSSKASKSEEDESIDGLISTLRTTNSSLADKLQELQGNLEQLKESGADDETVQSAIASDLASLTDAEKTELLSAVFGLRASSPIDSEQSLAYAHRQAAVAYGAATLWTSDPTLAYSA